MIKAGFGLSLGVAAALASAPATASEGVAKFYTGKTIQLVIG